MAKMRKESYIIWNTEIFPFFLPKGKVSVIVNTKYNTHCRYALSLATADA